MVNSDLPIMKFAGVRVAQEFGQDRSLSGVSLPAPGPLALHKCAVKRVSDSARPNQAQDRRSFAFVPDSAPIVVARWPKL